MGLTLLPWGDSKLTSGLLPHHPVNRIALALLLSAGALLNPGVVRAQANDMFPSKAAAEQRAKELKCSGAFAMGKEWMPCKNFDVYEKAVSKEK
jgi:hypothetical protein